MRVFDCGPLVLPGSFLAGIDRVAGTDVANLADPTCHTLRNGTSWRRRCLGRSPFSSSSDTANGSVTSLGSPASMLCSKAGVQECNSLGKQRRSANHGGG